MWNFIKNLNFVSTPWKIIILLGKCVGDHIYILRKYIWFSIPVPKIKFDPPPQGKNASQILGFSLKSINLDRCGNLNEKFNCGMYIPLNDDKHQMV